jgi:pyrroline-5-carboxylate reductase
MRIVLVGCGKMGTALRDGWLDRGVAAEDILAIDPYFAAEGRPGILADRTAIPQGFEPDVVVLAVKPQEMAATLPAYADFSTAVFLSIAAGTPLASLGQMLGGTVAVVRAMPNTPAAVRRGITVAVGNERVGDGQRAHCDYLLGAVGEVAWVTDESLMDAVTAVSGSGPAYVFLLAECLAASGAAAGLPEDLAQRLARATIFGAGELLRLSTESPEQLRVNVTSPGGTTAAALAILMADAGMRALMIKAVAAATERGRELGR